MTCSAKDERQRMYENLNKIIQQKSVNENTRLDFYLHGLTHGLKIYVRKINCYLNSYIFKLKDPETYSLRK